MPHPTTLEPLTVTVRGKHDSGKTTVASLIKMLLEDSGFQEVTVADLAPLPHDQKDDFATRLMRSRQRPVRIVVALEEP